MEVTCSGCNAKLNIPDEKLPKDQAVNISCPKCKGKITVEPKNAVSASSAGHADSSSDDSLELFYDESKLALILTDEATSNKIKDAVEEHGYRFIYVSSVRDALARLRLHHFDLIVLSEGFDGEEIYGGPIMNFINHMAMSSRRRIFLALISDKFKTMDNMKAFAMSANIVVNSNDLGKFSPILKRGVQEYEMFYKVFMDTLAEEGKI